MRAEEHEEEASPRPSPLHSPQQGTLVGVRGLGHCIRGGLAQCGSSGWESLAPPAGYGCFISALEQKLSRSRLGLSLGSPSMPAPAGTWEGTSPEKQPQKQEQASPPEAKSQTSPSPATYKPMGGLENPPRLRAPALDLVPTLSWQDQGEAS